jgi:hypothetical protein
MVTGGVITQLVYVAAKLGIADLLRDGPKSCDDLARSAEVHGPSLYRALRALSSLGIFTEVKVGHFGLTPMAAWLQRDIAGSFRAMPIIRGEWMYRAFADLLYSVRTGQPAFDQIYGMGLFQYLAQQPEAAEIFNQAMTASGASGGNSAIAAACDLSGIRTVVDIAGGEGSLLAALLIANPGVNGILFEHPAVIESARPVLQEAGVADRCELVGGDLFTAALPRGDVHIMKWILHDWDDDRSVAILKSCRRAINQRGRLLVIEYVMPPGDEPSPGKLGDIIMLATVSGRERDEEDYRMLFRAAEFELTRITPTTSPMSVIEGAPV